MSTAVIRPGRSVFGLVGHRPGGSIGLGGGGQFDPALQLTDDRCASSAVPVMVTPCPASFQLLMNRFAGDRGRSSVTS